MPGEQMNVVALATERKTARFGVMLLIALVSFVATLDNTIITVALPSAAKQLRLGPGEMAWVGISYMLAFAGFLLVAGTVVDRCGQRGSLLIGLTVFGLAAAAGGVATSAGWLIAARAVQGTAAAVVMPATLSVIRTALPERARDTAAAVWTAALAAALALGPLLGGALTQYLRWNWVLFVNIPFAVAGILLTLTYIAEHRAGARRAIDWRGAVLATTVAVSVVASLVGTAGSMPGTVIAIFAVVALLAGALLVAVERRVATPLVPLALLRERPFRASIVIQLFWGLGVSGIFFFTPLFLQDVVGLSPAGSGLPLLAAAVAVAAGTPFVARSTRRFGVAIAAGCGLVTVAIGLVVLALPGVHPATLWLLPGLLLIGLGSAFTTPLTTTALTVANADNAGIASGVLSAGRELSSALGVALMGAVVSLWRASAQASGDSGAASLAHGFLAALVVAAVLEMIAAGLTFSLFRDRGRQR
ncbi:MAG: MFS transporter [Sciscionella sp.]